MTELNPEIFPNVDADTCAYLVQMMAARTSSVSAFSALRNKIHATYPSFCQQPSAQHAAPCFNLSRAKNNASYATIITGDVEYGTTIWNGRVLSELDLTQEISWSILYAAIGHGDCVDRCLSDDKLLKKIQTLGEK